MRGFKSRLVYFFLLKYHTFILFITNRMAEDKLISSNSFQNGENTDTSDQNLPQNFFRSMLNMRHMTPGSKGVPRNVMGNSLINNSLPAGNNYALGYGKNEESGKLYFFNYNDQNLHGIYAFDALTQTITPVLLNLIDTNNVDILKFSKDYPINHVDIIADKLIYWVDGLNKARKFNILKAIDKTDTGYGTVINEDFITAYKQTGVYAPTTEYFTDLSRTSNYLYALQFKFCYRFYYDDGEISNASDFSGVAYPPNESYLGATAITFANNGINVVVETGNRLVTKIEILVKIDDLDWLSCIVLNKDQLGIPDYATYTYQFFNDGAYISVDNVKVNRPYSYLPDAPYTQAFLDNAMSYGRFKEGFGVVNVQGKVDITFIPFYLPSGTVSQLNNPSFITTLLSTDKSGGLFNTWFTTNTKFIIGFDVKKGNVFTINAYGGNGSKSQTFTANNADTAFTIASQVKQWLRGINSADFSFSNESTDGFGNVSWEFSIEAHEGKNAITFSSSVTPVNYSTLLDNGLSINTIKMGSTRKYGIVYEDDDGKTSLTYTIDALIAKTPYETEVILGQTAPIGLQQPIHTLTFYHRPPIWAKYWRLVRTEDTRTFLQMLIQQVNTVKVANEDTYLDMIVGSLFTYQKIHPDTILTYDFKRGDRLRLISNENSTPPTFYTPYFETEILNYSTETTETVSANIVIYGSNEVKSDKPVSTGQIGKFISINGVERLIVDVNIGDNKYILDAVYPREGTTDQIFPNFQLIDRRGIIRIKLPPASYNVVNQSLVEVYRPQQNIDNTSYLNFLDFQQKFPISNWGTATAAHTGNIQNQDGADPSGTPVVVRITQGDAYVRNRALPTNNDNENPQVIIDQICDPNFSDFYQSNMYSTGRVYPQDQAYGEVFFGSRIRFSNNYIEDTRINGLNDFDNTDRKDYNDSYGIISLMKYRMGYLFVFKQLRTAWTPVGKRVIADNAGTNLVSTSDHLLNDLDYADFEGGIGDNPESWGENEHAQYAAYPNAGVFVRIAQNGTEPISKIYFIDEKARAILGIISKYKLRINGEFDRKNDEMVWTYPDYLDYLYNNNFNIGNWQTLVNAYPAGTTFAITQQPAHATATVVGDLIEITGTSTLGNDFFKLQGTLPDSSLTPVMNFCFTVTLPENRTISYRPQASSVYCLQSGDTPLDDFDFLVLRYVWTNGSGTDLDTFTGFQGTGTIYDGDPLSRTNWVGYNQNPIPPALNGSPPANRLIPQASATPYLNWGTDNTTGDGVEAILLDIAQFNTDFPGANNPVTLRMNAVWYASRDSGNITVGIKTYKGGTMALVGTDFVNTGGVLVDDISYPVNINMVNSSSMIANSQNVALMKYDKTTNTAILTLV